MARMWMVDGVACNKIGFHYSTEAIHSDQICFVIPPLTFGTALEPKT